MAIGRSSAVSRDGIYKCSIVAVAAERIGKKTVSSVRSVDRNKLKSGSDTAQEHLLVVQVLYLSMRLYTTVRVV
jgi:hypothetical protein